MSDRAHDQQTRFGLPDRTGTAPVPVRFRGRDTLSLRQIDEFNRVPKGTAFRRFKACRPRMQEGHDYFRLDAAEHAGWIADLRARGLVYPTSIHVVLVTESGYRCLIGRG
ncbi:hypothetical protein TVNIR_3414 [Thioalkalivibrio nitratireducens DSM 14787]|uniref:Uncharacterized protein n=1 Tax=Thioalkalivibrio nitratireducens (strain DSM 14787 / UNIQEM 213 / ALEN2) TaxID=1255043 RepID=L0E1G8_THIND|nr:ORF6N domain-containing protein [Thioalkalivibrio nitratireducens]AGA35050.1 hypothetical protein TVNIR_3414 [Thioalkalivibrio nitratireducens DSM 14787]